MFLTYSNDMAGSSAGSVALRVNWHARATVPDRMTHDVPCLSCRGTRRGSRRSQFSRPVTSIASGAAQDECAALSAGRHLDRGATPAVSQQAILLPRYVDQFHQQEVATDAGKSDESQDKEDGARRERLFAAVIGRLVRSGLVAGLIVHVARTFGDHFSGTG